MEIGKTNQEDLLVGKSLLEEEEEKLVGKKQLELFDDSVGKAPIPEQPQQPSEQQQQPQTQAEALVDAEVQDPEEAEKKDDMDALDVATDIVLSPLKGIAGAAEGLIGLADYVTGDDLISDWYVREKDSKYRSKTFVGGFIEGAVQFGVGFVPGLGIASKAGKALQLSKLGKLGGTAVSKTLNATLKGSRTLDVKTLRTVAKLKKTSKAAVKAAAGGAISDFLVWKGQEKRLSNFLKENAGMEGNAVIEWMAYDPDKNESELEGRFKNALEGLVVGELAGAAIFGVKKGIQAIPEGSEAVEALKKIFGAFRTKNKLISEQIEKGETPNEFLAVDKATKDASNVISESESRALSELNQRIKDHSKVKQEEALTGTPFAERSESRSTQTARNEAKEVQEEFKFDEIDVDNATDEQADKWLRDNADIPGGVLSKETKKATIREIIEEGKKGGAESMRKKLGDTIIERLKKAGVGNDTNPISYLSGLRTITEAPELRALLSRVSKEVIAKGEDLFDPKSAASLYNETEEVIRKGLEAAGGNNKNVTLEALRKRPDDLKIVRTEAEVLYTALEKAGSQAFENYLNAERVVLKGESLVDVELEGLGKVSLNQERAMQELSNSMETFAVLQEMWADFGTQLSLALRDRESLYKTGGIGKDIAGQNRTLRIAIEESNTMAAKLMRRNRNKGYGDKKILRDYQKLFKKNKVDNSVDVKTLMDRLNANASSLNAFSKYNLVQKKGLAVAQEWYINAILQAPTSWIANILGGAIVLPLRQIETIIGAGLTGDFDVAKAHMRVFFDLQAFKDAAKYAWRSGYDDEARSVAGYAAFRDDRLSAPGGEIRIDNPEGNTLKSAINLIGNGVRMPSRIMMMGDEFFKQMTFRARTKTSLALEGYKRGLDKEPGKLAEFIESGYNELITKDGRFRNEDNIRKEAYLELDRRRKNGEVIADQKAFVNSYLDEHLLNNELRLEDGIISSVLTKESRDELVKSGTDWALVNTFTNQVENKFFKLTGQLATASPWMTFIIPFVKTPSNILLFALGRVAPRGAAKDILSKRQALNEIRGKSLDEIYEELGADLPAARKQAQEQLSILEGEASIEQSAAVGKLAFGVMAVGTMFMNIEAIKDRITGAEPEDEGQKNVWKNTGKMPYSIKLGDKWYSYQRLDPFATIMGLMADFVHLHDEARAKAALNSEFAVSEEYEEQEPYFRTLFGIVATTMARNVSNKSYIENMGELMDILEKPSEAIPNIGSNVLSSFVPNAINWSQNVYEEEPALLEARSLFDKIKKRLPESMRNGEPLMPRRNFLGEILRKDSSTTGSFLKALNPIYASEDTSDIVDLELAQHGTGRVIPPHVRKIGGRKVDLRKIRNKKGQTAYDRFLELSGTIKQGAGFVTLRQKLRAIMESNDYANQPEVTDFNRDVNHPRTRMFSKAINSYRKRAFNQMLSEFREFF